ncbi:MAG: spore germination protein [Candidatus Merdivicinus sp.]|jgi:spore germination protein KA
MRRNPRSGRKVPPVHSTEAREPTAEEAIRRLSSNLSQNLILLREKLCNAADLVTRPVTAGGVRMSFVMMEGMTTLSKLDEAVIRPLMTRQFASGREAFDFIEQTAIVGDVQDVYEFDRLIQLITSGFVAILIDGMPTAIVMGAQGFAYRSISEPDSEVNEKGSRESFTEPIKVNITLIRRRMKSGQVCFEMMDVGSESKTSACLVYSPQAVNGQLLDEVKRRLAQIPLKMVLDTGYLQPYLEGKPLSIFSEVGTTERPDTVCAKIEEGRVVILLDGTPHALIVPYLFVENFQSFDDYSNRPYFATFVRLLKYFSFFVSILLPGAYVAVATFHPAVLPHALLFNIASAEETTPFPLMVEAIIIHLIYEIMREAGLRLPRPVGHAVSIVGALVIGDAAVTAGIIGAPMVMVVALTAISSFVVPSLYEPVVVLRFAFIVLGGLTGLYGISLVMAMLLVNICQINNLGVPYTSPVTPLTPRAMRDVFVRIGWKRMTSTERLQDMRGSDLDHTSLRR